MFSGCPLVLLFRVMQYVSCGLTGIIQNKRAKYELKNKNRIN